MLNWLNELPSHLMQRLSKIITVRKSKLKLTVTFREVSAVDDNVSHLFNAMNRRRFIDRRDVAIMPRAKMFHLYLHFGTPGHISLQCAKIYPSR